MDKIQLEEFVKSIDQDLEIKVGKQFTEVTVPLSKLYSIARKLREERRLSLISSSACQELITDRILVSSIISARLFMIIP